MGEAISNNLKAQFLGHIAFVADEGMDLQDGVPVVYHKFFRVFLPSEADKLPPHRPYNHAIDLEPWKQPR